MNHFHSLLGALQRLNVANAVAWSSAVLTMAVAYSSAQLTWRLWPLPPTAAGPAPAAQAATAAEQSRSPGLERIAELHLFGEAGVKAVERRVIDAPETRLNLTLRGVFAAKERTLAFAIISAGARDEQRYRVGDSVPGGAVLTEVLADRVILERNGRFETLRLPKDTMSFTQNAPERSVTTVSRDLGRQIGSYRRRLLANPREAMKLVQVQPVMEGGKLTGYRVNPRAEHDLFRRAGLQSGDVVTSVNGVPLNDPTRLGSVISELSTASQVTLELTRGGRRQTVVVPIQP